ncbi:PREDICTED: transmembrane inner ear expressed protein [Ceratosolen solmsi marchali]|uniref:Transmembrane inner ear expressed protein n=1 Tax=Ceratosolen solmsi marchali TaxID=326594 RepID=A0AAJ6YUG3_9HYME|nr:PREDICTED: transmembrane inner ear expressed protein [Ceratosolen solmsi marchali]
METSAILSDLSSPLTLPPCSGESTNITGECIEQETEPEWESEVVGIKVWQLVGIILSVILAITIMICCCIRFRIPRTKQEIEADYIRKKLTRNFRKELAKIHDKEMDEMDLKRALDRVNDVLSAVETDETQMQDKKIIYKRSDRGFGTKFNAMFQDMRIRFNKEEHTESNTMI